MLYCVFSSGQHLLEEYEQHLADEELRHDVSQAKLEKRSKMLGDVKSGVEHLTEKLKTLKTVRRVSLLVHVSVLHVSISANFLSCEKDKAHDNRLSLISRVGLSVKILVHSILVLLTLMYKGSGRTLKKQRHLEHQSKLNLLWFQ